MSMIGKRRATAQPGPETDEAPTEPAAGPASLADEAAEVIGAAEEARTRAALARVEAEELLTTARAEAAGILSTAETEARRLTAAAAATDRDAAGLEERAGYLRDAAQLADQAEEADQRVTDLETERAGLAEQAATLDGKLTSLAADREEVERQLGAARDAGDLDAITQAQSRAAAIADLAAALTVRRATVAQRAAAIGDGTGYGELHDALAVAAGHEAELQRLRAILDPEGPEALAAEWWAILEAQRARIAEEAARKPPVPQRVVRLG